MKSYAEKNIGRCFLDKIKNFPIDEYFTEICTPISNIKEEFRDEFYVNDSNIPTSSYVMIWKYEIEDMLIDVWDYEYTGYYDTDSILNTYSGLIKESPQYLVCAYNCTWDGNSGYAFSNSIERCFSRSYDVTQYIVGSSSGGKVLKLKEASHDCPMGYSVVIIALTDKEYDSLCNADFDTIFKFADEKSKSIIEF